ncbi:MAG: HAD family hydrolase [Alphaproteobacteria bacterium]
MMIERPKAVFFDWDGTLVDSFAFLHGAHNHTRAQFGMEPFALEVFEGYFGKPREQLYEDIYGRENIEAAKGHFENYVYAHHMDQLEPICGAQEVLDVFKTLEIPCGVVTNKKRALVEAEIAHYGWQDYFSSVVGAGEAEADKPSSAPLLLGVERAGFDFAFSDIWYVGDTDNDLACANDAGVRSILILDQPKAADLLAKYKVDLHQNNCGEFAGFLLQYGAEGLQK